MGFLRKWSTNGGFSTSTLVYRRVIYRSICIPKCSNRMTRQNCCPSQFIYFKVARSQLIHTSTILKSMEVEAKVVGSPHKAWNHQVPCLNMSLHSCRTNFWPHLRACPLKLTAATLCDQRDAVGWNWMVQYGPQDMIGQSQSWTSAEEPFRHLSPSAYRVEFSPLP